MINSVMQVNGGVAMQALEIKTKETRDSWGNKGVATYKRLSEWFDNGGRWIPSATVYVSDTSTGHGWQGQMTKERWESIQ